MILEVELDSLPTVPRYDFVVFVMIRWVMFALSSGKSISGNPSGKAINSGKATGVATSSSLQEMKLHTIQMIRNRFTRRLFSYQFFSRNRLAILQQPDNVYSRLLNIKGNIRIWP